MARRTTVIGLFMALAMLAMGCHHRHFLCKHHWHHDYADPCSCSCSSAVLEVPVPTSEPLPAPKRMPSTTMTSNPVLTGRTK